MHKKTKKHLVLLIVFVFLISACSSKNDAPDPGQVLTQAAQLASQGSTLTAIAKPPTSTPLPPPATATLEPVPSATPDIIPTNALTGGTEIAGTTPEVQPISTQAAVFPTAANVSSGCYKAGFTYDGPPWDYTHFHGTVSFVKEWRLQNIGTCAWTSEVYLVHYATTIIENGAEVRESGETFGRGTEIIVISDPIAPGGYLDLAIEFTAPTMGNETYKVYYKLYGPGGVFNISGGSIWFIVDVTPP